MSTLSKLNKEKFLELFIGALGIYFCYLVAGIIQERLIKHSYINKESGTEDYFRFPIYFMLFPHGFTYLMGLLYNCFKLPIN